MARLGHEHGAGVVVLLLDAHPETEQFLGEFGNESLEWRAMRNRDSHTVVGHETVTPQQTEEETEALTQNLWQPQRRRVVVRWGDRPQRDLPSRVLIEDGHDVIA